MAIQVGQKAPEFNLKDHKGREFQLSEYRGKKVLLSFHPLAWTSVCAKQMQSLEEYWETFQDLNTVVVGVSVDSVPCKKAWAETLGVNRVPLLSDFWPHGEVARSYWILRKEGVFREGKRHPRTRPEGGLGESVSHQRATGYPGGPESPEGRVVSEKWFLH